jgi:hypothetical protein
MDMEAVLMAMNFQDFKNGNVIDVKGLVLLNGCVS